MTASELAGRPVASGCRSRPLAWSSGSKRLIIYQQELGLCPATSPICPTGNIVALDLHSDSATTLIRATYLREKKLDDPKIVRWDEQAGVLYAWSMTSPIGGLGALLAIRVPSGKILWSKESYGAVLLTDGRIANLDRKATDLERTGFNWEWQYGAIRDGRVEGKYVPQPTSGGGEQGVISPSGRFVWWQPQGSQSEVRFGTKADADVWGHRLPAGFQSEDGVWTPSDHLIVQAYKKTTQDGILLGVWLFQPGMKTSTKLFESSYPLPTNPNDDFTQYSTVRLPDGRLKTLHNPLVLARWAR